ncbi:TPA: restriction endonuclease subunit S [Neisseria cinerea]
MRRYESYKDSGVEWLGEIPSHWELKRLKQLFVEKKHKQNLSLNCGAISFGKVIEKADDKVTEATKRSYQEVLKGEFLINPLNLNYDLISLRIALSEIDVVVSAGYIVLKEKQIINKKYFSYLLHRYDVAYMKLLGSGVRQTINYGHISDSILVIPPLSEQQKIAQFLDEKTAKIDQAVDLAEKQIALLKEHKQILIQNAVTRGLNPDVPLKDSGVEWIGQVPEHWEVKRFRNLFDFGKGLSITKENLQDEGIPCVNYGEIHSKYGFEVIPERDALKCVDSKYLVFKNSMLNKGDFVFADTSEDIEGSGNFTYLNSSTRIFAGYHTIITRLKITAIHRYIAYYFDSLSFRNQIRNKVKGVKVFSITQSILKGTFVLLPNLKEQQQIANYLDTQTAKIDQAIALKTAHIEKLKEYKSVLINNVVTGKVQV